MAQNRSTPFPIEVRASARQRLGMPPARFLHDYWQKRPLLIRNAFAHFTPPLSPDDLAGLACMEGSLARIVAHAAPPSRNRRLRQKEGMDGATAVRHDGSWKVLTGPFDDATFAKLPEARWTLLVQDVDKWDDGTAALLEHFDFVPSWRIDDVMISYATDAGGVGAHVDQYDVFLLQGLGQRRWAIDARPNPPTDCRDDVELKLLRQFAPSHEWVLGPGDMLYLPPGVPHDGVAVGECMTYSIGMRAPSSAEMLVDFAHAIAEHLPDEQRYGDPDLHGVRASGEIDDAAFRRVARALPWLRLGNSGAATDAAARAWFGGFITRYRIAQAPIPRKRRIDRDTLAQRLPRCTFERDPWARFAWCRNGSEATLFATGQSFDAPLAWAKRLCMPTRSFDGAQLAKLPQLARGVTLLAALLDAGQLRMRGH